MLGDCILPNRFKRNPLTRRRQSCGIWLEAATELQLCERQLVVLWGSQDMESRVWPCALGNVLWAMRSGPQQILNESGCLR